jgi:hypothetical protein
MKPVSRFEEIALRQLLVGIKSALDTPGEWRWEWNYTLGFYVPALMFLHRIGEDRSTLPVLMEGIPSDSVYLVGTEFSQRIIATCDDLQGEVIERCADDSIQSTAYLLALVYPLDEVLALSKAELEIALQAALLDPGKMPWETVLAFVDAGMDNDIISAFEGASGAVVAS